KRGRRYRRPHRWLRGRSLPTKQSRLPPPHHSTFKFLIGLSSAVFTAITLTVASVTTITNTPATTKTQTPISTRYTKSCNQLRIANHAIGNAITTAPRPTRTTPADNNIARLPSGAPNTLRMPISFTRCFAAYDDNPNNPKHASTIAIAENKFI